MFACIGRFGYRIGTCGATAPTMRGHRPSPPVPARVTAPARPPGGGRPLSTAGQPGTPLGAQPATDRLARRHGFGFGFNPDRLEARCPPPDRRTPPLEPLSRLPHRPRPLLVCADERLLDDLLRLAAAAGVEVDVAHDGPSARPRWSAAPLVLVGADVADSLAAAPLPRRPDVARGRH